MAIVCRTTCDIPCCWRRLGSGLHYVSAGAHQRQERRLQGLLPFQDRQSLIARVTGTGSTIRLFAQGLPPQVGHDPTSMFELHRF